MQNTFVSRYVIRCTSVNDPSIWNSEVVDEDGVIYVV